MFCYLYLNFIGLGQDQVLQTKYLVLRGLQPDLCGRLLPPPFSRRLLAARQATESAIGQMVEGKSCFPQPSRCAPMLFWSGGLAS